MPDQFAFEAEDNDVSRVSTEKVRVNQLKTHPRNYREHPPDQLQHIMHSIREHGFYRHVVVARDYTILAGHGVVEAVKQLMLTWVPVLKLDLDPNEPRALKILTGDNEIGKSGMDDDRKLTELLKDVLTAEDLLGTGYDPQRLAALLFVTRPESEIRDMSEAAEWVGLPAYEAGMRQIKLVINFPSREERERFVREHPDILIDYRYTYTWTTRWPFTEREKRSDVWFQQSLL